MSKPTERAASTAAFSARLRLIGSTLGAPARLSGLGLLGPVASRLPPSATALPIPELTLLISSGLLYFLVRQFPRELIEVNIVLSPLQFATLKVNIIRAH